MKIMVTGSAGFIGAAVSERLVARGDDVIGVDNLDPYYDVELKKARLARLTPSNHFHEFPIDIADRDALAHVFETEQPERVVNLAAQAGVRYSLENPHAYVNTNIVGFTNILEGCWHHGVGHLVYA